MLTKTPNILTGGCTSPSEVAALRHLAISSFSSWNHPCSAPSDLTPCMSEALHANYMHDPCMIQLKADAWSCLTASPSKSESISAGISQLPQTLPAAML